MRFSTLRPSLFALLFSLPFFQFSPFLTQKTADWVFKSEKSGIKIYYKDDGTGIYGLRLVTTVETSLHAIAALLTDVESYPKWVYKTSEAWRVRTVSPTEMSYYNNSDFPWPLDDRDVVVDSKIWQNEATKVLTSASSAVDGLVEKRKNRVRMAVTTTNWTCTPTTGGKIEIEYTLKSDPGGLLPDWLVNMALDVGPVETMKNFKVMLDKDEYKNAHIDYVKD